MDDFECVKCKRGFKSQVALDSHTQAIHPGGVSNIVSKESKRKLEFGLIIGAVLLIVIWIGLQIVNSKTLPPIDMAGHIEVSPISHISRTPLQIEVQKHMLEHADGKNRPGVIINYNCEQYKCEPGLIEKLESFTVKYPEHVYVAPFPNMDAKIALTKLGKIKILEQYDEQAIDDFI